MFGKDRSHGIASPGTEGPGLVPVITGPGFVLLRTYPTPATRRREPRSLGCSGAKSQFLYTYSFQISGPQLIPILKPSDWI